MVIGWEPTPVASGPGVLTVERAESLMEHRVSFKVYYEDTDCLGVVYHANYLKFMERGRTDFLAARGRGVEEWNRDGILIVVHTMTVKFRKAAVLGDLLDVVSSFSVDSRYRGTFHQRIEKAGDLVTEADVVVVCLDPQQQLTEFPEGLRALGAG
jgi:tol-pal system-associated acyl-CoA thioesterase